MATIRHDLAVADLNDPLRLLGDPPIVRHDDHGVSDSVQLMQNGHQRLTAGAIQRAGRFIGQNDFRAVHKSSGNTDPLLLPTGKLRRTMATALRQPEASQQMRGPQAALGGRHGGIQCRDSHVLTGRQIGHQVVALKNKADMPTAEPRQAIAVGLPNRHPVDVNIPLRRLVQTTDNIHQRRFSGAGGADDSDHFSPLNAQGNAFEDRDFLLSGLKLA